MSGLDGNTVLVTGATGFIGGELVERLVVDHGAKVRTLVRNYTSASRLARFEVDMIPGDISDTAAVQDAAHGCAVIFHCAYDFAGGKERGKGPNLPGTEAIAQAALKNGSRVVHVSTGDVYGWPQHGSLTEETPPDKGISIYGETKLAAERLLLDHHKKSGLLVSVLQPTIVYGPFSKPWTVGPASQLKTGRVVLVDGGQGTCNAVYIDDVVDALLLAAVEDRAIGETFLISGPRSITWKDFYGAFEQIMEVEATVPMSVEEVEQAVAKGLGGSANGISLRQVFTNVLREPRVRSQVAKNPRLRTTYHTAKRVLPRSILNFAKKRVMTSPVRGAGPGVSTDTRRMYWPDAARIQLCRSRADVSIEKARRLLGYDPKYDFEKGMKLTGEYLQWAKLLG